ncbi:chemotaxis protein CheW [Halorubrum sp. DTA98]|uniref:chemotaxis protein CheW n=1 Tax=Halorubrum sp. DTA98 TaxID=3402163 RepID=UPI003AB0B368
MPEALGQLLEFRLGDEQYCIDIAHVDEIVDANDVTPVPNSPPHVMGVTDLRGRTTTVIDPSVVLNIDAETEWSHIVVLDTSGTDEVLGWLVCGVDQVLDVEEQELDTTAATDGDAIEGVLSREDSFVVQVDPTSVHS